MLAARQRIKFFPPVWVLRTDSSPGVACSPCHWWFRAWMMARASIARAVAALPIVDAGFRLGNGTARELPGDPDNSNKVRRVAGALYSRVMPTPAARATLIGWSDDVARALGAPCPPPQPLVDVRWRRGLLPARSCPLL